MAQTAVRTSTITVTVTTRAATAASNAVIAAVLAGQLLLSGGWGEHSWVVLVAGLLAGLPHGAVDHLVPGYLLAEHAPRVLLVLVGYVAVAAAAWAALQLAPAVALVVFVVVSAWHFGTGEAAHDAARRPSATQPVVRSSSAAARQGTRASRTGRTRRAVRAGRTTLLVVATGGSVLVLPVVGDPDAVAPIIALLVPGSSGLLPPAVVTTATAVVFTAVTTTVVLTAGQGHWLTAVEVVLLAALGLLVAPLAAFGGYFGAWHAVRHIARLLEPDPRNSADLAAGSLARPLGRFTRSAALPTAAALSTVLTLWSLADGWRGFVTANLSLLAGLTVPHVVVVVWWDRHRHRRPPSARAARPPSACSA